ncbi:C6 transcription factor [Penicillium canariense]|uniref:C6 transcription factor n=1 Tax=Penicillium canariense TaxID=189055 RepID=A0A9W9LUT6_9EURO|nr:C6 transcription factor [Penicillium canariense]KAJ5176207.1 C6 transcription factor [Penicillium canariense]
MRRNRACDQCAARKAKCDRKSPCRRCIILDLPCSVQRGYTKPGPKGPWAKRKQQEGAGSQKSPKKRATDVTATDTSYMQRVPEARINDKISVDVQRYLLYSRELYPLWPVINLEDLITRLQNGADLAAYALSTAFSAVVLERLAQLGRTIEDVENPSVESEKLVAESENFLGFDQAKHYATLPEDSAQLHLRILWILYITERGHTTRFDLPRILRLDPQLPALYADENPSGLLPFISMTRLFQNFGFAMDGFEADRTHDFFADMDMRLQETPELLTSASDTQRADFLITKQWMRIILWKRAIFYVELSADTAGGTLSVSFPEKVARNVVAYIHNLPRGIVRSHGLGMQMKLADIAISLADVLSCAPFTVSESHQLMQREPETAVSPGKDFRGALECSLRKPTEEV